MTRLPIGVLGAGDPVGDAWAAAADASPEFDIAWRAAVTDAGGSYIAARSLAGLLIAAASRQPGLLMAAHSGKPVLCPAPVARTWAEWRELTRVVPADATVLSASELRLLAPLVEAQRLATCGEAGPLFSAYIAYRARAGGPDLDALLFGALDYLHWCVGAEATAVWAARRQAPDAVIAHFTFPDNRKATVEAALTLPTAFPQPVEFEVELMCEEATLRATPFDQAIVLQTDRTTSARPWFPDPGLAALDGLRRAAAGDMAGLRTWTDDGPVLRLLDAVRRSLDGAGVVTAGEAARSG